VCRLCHDSRRGSALTADPRSSPGTTPARWIPPDPELEMPTAAGSTNGSPATTAASPPASPSLRAAQPDLPQDRSRQTRCLQPGQRLTQRRPPRSRQPVVPPPRPRFRTRLRIALPARAHQSPSLQRGERRIHRPARQTRRIRDLEAVHAAARRPFTRGRAGRCGAGSRRGRGRPGRWKGGRRWLQRGRGCGGRGSRGRGCARAHAPTRGDRVRPRGRVR